MRKFSTGLIVNALVGVLVGIALLAWTDISLNLISSFYGLYLLFEGLSGILNLDSRAGITSRPFGVLLILTGVFMIVQPGVVSAGLVLLLIAIHVSLLAVASFIGGFTLLKMSRWGLGFIALGLLQTAFVLSAVFNTEQTINALLAFIAIVLICGSLLQFLFGLLTRVASKDIEFATSGSNIIDIEQIK